MVLKEVYGFTVSHPTGNCTDLPNQGNYSNRQDNVQSVESDHVITGIINKNLKELKEQLRLGLATISMILIRN